MTTSPLRPLLDWREATRARTVNGASIGPSRRYVLCWLQQALRAFDNPVVDAAVLLANSLGLPVLVYYGLREDYPFVWADALGGWQREQREVRP